MHQQIKNNFSLVETTEKQIWKKSLNLSKKAIMGVAQDKIYTAWKHNSLRLHKNFVHIVTLLPVVEIFGKIRY